MSESKECCGGPCDAVPDCSSVRAIVLSVVDFKAEVARIVAYYKELAADGLSLADGWNLMTRAIATVVQLVGYVADATPAERKQLAVDAAATLFDEVIAPIDLPVPDFLEKSLVDPALRALLLQLAAGAVDALTTVLAAAPPPAPPATPPGDAPAPPQLPPGFVPY